MKREKREKIITVKTEGAEQTFDISEVGAKRPLTIKGWIKRLAAAGYAKIRPDMIS